MAAARARIVRAEAIAQGWTGDQARRALFDALVAHGPRPAIPARPETGPSHDDPAQILDAMAEAIAAAARLAQTHAKPFSTPPGFSAPTLGEQFAYAARRHPYSRLGYGAVFLVGAAVWWFASSSSGASEGEKKEKKLKE